MTAERSHWSPRDKELQQLPGARADCPAPPGRGLLARRRLPRPPHRVARRTVSPIMRGGHRTGRPRSRRGELLPGRGRRGTGPGPLVPPGRAGRARTGLVQPAPVAATSPGARPHSADVGHRAAPPQASAACKGPDLDLLAELRAEAVAGGADEALLLDHQGHILEGTTTSLLWWRDDVLCAPALTGSVLPGVTRRILLAEAARAGFRTGSGVARRRAEAAGRPGGLGSERPARHPPRGALGGRADDGEAVKAPDMDRLVGPPALVPPVLMRKEAMLREPQRPRQARVRDRSPGPVVTPVGETRRGQEGRTRPRRPLRSEAPRLSGTPGSLLRHRCLCQGRQGRPGSGSWPRPGSPTT